MSHACSFSTAKFLKFGGARTATPLKHFRLASKSFSRQMAMHSIHHDGSRGALIVLEGLDRSGKTSQCSRLVSHLEGKGISVEAWRFPDRKTDIGIMISSYLANKSQLDDQAVHLLFSANRWEKRLAMETKLRSGTTIVVDRYSYSGVAFSVAKGLDVEWCKAPETGLIAPDLVIYLDLPPEEATKRGGYGTERYEQLEFQRNVAHQYQKLRDSTWKVLLHSLILNSPDSGTLFPCCDRATITCHKLQFHACAFTSLDRCSSENSLHDFKLNHRTVHLIFFAN